VATSDARDYTPSQKTAATIVLLDGREDLKVVSTKLNLESNTADLTLLERHAGLVCDTMHARYPVLTDYQAACAAALAPFTHLNNRQRE